MKKFLALYMVILLFCGFATIAESALYDRGNGLIYDSDKNITWLQDANTGGAMTWSSALTWAADLSYMGITDWRLPSVYDPYALMGNYDGGELAHLYYSYGVNPSTPSPFTNVQGSNVVYWYNETWYDPEDPTNTSSAWAFRFSDGYQC
jgi:hypothetical protein